MSSSRFARFEKRSKFTRSAEGKAQFAKAERERFEAGERRREAARKAAR
jgi:hypothetical protein